MNMLQTKKEELKKQGKKGFTLMELLIVVAIIAVLVAIAIPLFTNQLEKAREATDMANLRSAYAECSASLLTGEKGKNVTFDNDANPTSASKTVTITQKKKGWEGENASVTIGGTALPTIGDTVPATIKITVASDGTVTFE